MERNHLILIPIVDSDGNIKSIPVYSYKEFTVPSHPDEVFYVHEGLYNAYLYFVAHRKTGEVLPIGNHYSEQEAMDATAEYLGYYQPVDYQKIFEMQAAQPGFDYETHYSHLAWALSKTSFTITATLKVVPYEPKFYHDI